jgi:hypothetical protein
MQGHRIVDAAARSQVLKRSATEGWAMAGIDAGNPCTSRLLLVPV